MSRFRALNGKIVAIWEASGEVVKDGDGASESVCVVFLCGLVSWCENLLEDGKGTEVLLEQLEN